MTRGVRAATTGLAVVSLMAAVLAVPTAGRAVPAREGAHDRAVQRPAATLQLATWNFCNQSCPGWERRLQAFTRTVAATTPDVLAVQEVDTRDQRLAMTAAALRPLGYVEADRGIYRSCPGGCESHLFVRTSTTRVIVGKGAASEAQSRYAGLVPDRVLPARARANPMAYAYVEHIGSGTRLLAVSLHLEKQNGSDLNGADDQARNAAVRNVARWAAADAAELGVAGTPTAIMGDFNSYPRKQPNGPHRVLQQMGYRNAENARTKVGGQYATVNKTPADARWNGFPPKPRRFPLGGPRIDGILTKGLPAARRHQVYIRTQPDGSFDERYRASDHNLVRAWFRLTR